MWGHLEIAVFLPLAGYLVMIDLAHHGSKVDRGVLENVIRFGALRTEAIGVPIRYWG